MPRSSCQRSLTDAKPFKSQIFSSHGGKIIIEIRTLTLLLEFSLFRSILCCNYEPENAWMKGYTKQICTAMEDLIHTCDSEYR